MSIFYAYFYIVVICDCIVICDEWKLSQSYGLGISRLSMCRLGHYEIGCAKSVDKTTLSYYLIVKIGSVDESPARQKSAVMTFFRNYSTNGIC